MENNIKLEFPFLGCCGSACFINKHFARSVTVASESLLCCVAVAVLGEVSHSLENAAAQNMLCQTAAQEHRVFFLKDLGRSFQTLARK